MSASLLTALLPAEEEYPAWDLPMPPWAYGLIALVAFIALLLVVWAFRNVAGNMIYGPGGPRQGQSRYAEHGHGTGATAARHGSAH